MRPLPLTISFALTVISVQAENPVDFSREILPLLSNNCFECHGPDERERKAGLRLDTHEGALALLESGDHGVVPGDSGKSSIVTRMLTTDADDRMPPIDSGKSMRASEIAKIRQWIDEGAAWGGHWAFEKPERPSVPSEMEGWRTANAIDRFIQARLHEADLAFESRADKETLIRRVTLDLTGLPPTVKEVDAFLADTSAEAFERVVDRLLRSKKFGEHMARIWLDAARYADTHGLHLDNERTIWPYRDWVIDAFNRNQPFDQFTIEQLAGDLLPEPSLPQRVATGFNRCNVTTSEGGSIDEEYYVRYAVDRVETTSTVWLGLTAGCASCHDHKFDPLTQKEFYQLFSYFYSLTEKAMDGNIHLPPPSVKVPTDAQRTRQTQLTAMRESVRAEIDTIHQDLTYTDPHLGEPLGELSQADHVWVDDALPEGAQGDGNEGADSWKWIEDPVVSGERASTRTASGLSQHFFIQAKTPLVIGSHDRLFAYVYLDPKNPPQTVQLQFNDGSWDHRAYWGANKGHASNRKGTANHHAGDLPKPGKWTRLEVSAEAVGLQEGAKVHGLAFTQYDGTVHWDKAGVVSVALTDAQLASLSLWEQFRKHTKAAPLDKALQDILDTTPNNRTEAQRDRLRRHFLEQVHPTMKASFAQQQAALRAIDEELAAIDKAIPATLVMEERKEPRQAHILERGEYTEKREAVSSQVPEWILPGREDLPPNRLGLAQWLVDPEHPLTARVTVNRFWQQLFGTGLVKTSEDFGIQGEQPSHPELLDWLALDFVGSGWDVKRFFKQLVLSETYQQSSRVTAAKRERDPENRLLARGPRFRLDAETIRDQALAVSGLLVHQLGGKSVKPYQPSGLWKPVAFGGSNTQEFKQDSGAALYRRSMYTFWKRTAPPPSMATFDAPNRETCMVRRARTNTPLQALVLMNDVQYIEAARHLAARTLREGGATLDERLAFAVRTVLARRPTPTEAASLLNLYEDQLAAFEADTQAAKDLLATGDSPRVDALDPNEHAAWTMVAHLLLNLSETVTKG